jgi:Ni,Fe-hydrogenase III small subunit/formate hydrogenlyase subunit 6/NADH:ubiquinone oxidoreductase subunit I
MFDIIRQSLKTGVVTEAFPSSAPPASARARGRPEIDWANWKDARPAAAACPTGAISIEDANNIRVARLDLAGCVFCGLCADAAPQIRMTSRFQCAARRRDALVSTARYILKNDGSHERLLESPTHTAAPSHQSGLSPAPPAPPPAESFEALGLELKERAAKMFGRSLHIRQVDAGSCNGCEIEIAGLNSPVYDIERFGIHFVASPRHADMLLVTGPVTRNMEPALRKTCEAMPGPGLVVAVGACGCSGGIFGQNYATCGGVDSVLPVDIYIPGCPPNPHALLHGILAAIGQRELESGRGAVIASQCDNSARLRPPAPVR